MAHPFWPLFDLEVRTPRVTLRYLTDELAVELLAVAGRGVHDPSFMPFAAEWTDAPSPQMERDAYRFYWRCRAETAPEAWNIQLAVIEDDHIVGSTSAFATSFPTTRSFETGSWLGRTHQGHGLGTEMRIATLHLGFLAFDAAAANTGAFSDNAASLGVTRKLGYTANGVDTLVRRGQAAESRRFRMTRRHFDADVRRDDVEITGDEAARALLGISRST